MVTFFSSLNYKLTDWFNAPGKRMKLDGLSSAQWAFFLADFVKYSSNKGFHSDQLIVCPDSEVAETVYAMLDKQIVDYNVHLFPGLETSPYGGILSSEKNLYHRFRVLDELSFCSLRSIVVCSVEAFLLRLPPISFFSDNSFNLEVEQIISTSELADRLVAAGYVFSTTIEEPGTFSVKGEIVDIYPISHTPVRLHYYDEMIEKIFAINLTTQRTEHSITFQQIHIAPTPHFFTNNQLTSNLRERLPKPGPKFREKFERRKLIFERLSNNTLFDDYPAYVPLFFDNTSLLTDHFPSEKLSISIVDGQTTSQSILEYIELMRSEFDYNCSDVATENLLPAPSSLYELSFDRVIDNFKTIELNNLSIIDGIDNSLESSVSIHLERIKPFLSKDVNLALPKPDFIKQSLLFIKKKFEKEGKIIFVTLSEHSKSEITHLLKILEFPFSIMERIHFLYFPLDYGFYYPLENTLVISDGDLFSIKRSKTKKVNFDSIDPFAEQIATLKKGDYVSHNDHGIGIYQGLESMEVNGAKADFLILHYQNNDKIYVPVYKMNLIQKHADAASSTKIDSLRNNKFQALRDRVKNSVKKLAFDLIKLQAKRESSIAFSFSEPDHYFREFELEFPFKETPDQEKAIEHVLELMQKKQPMDLLVCGDVGYGKTEVAMRAAFKAVVDHKQVAILVPTTLLALQHYSSFTERFKKFPVSIEFLSRLKTAPESKRIIEKIGKGEVDIIIGTHKLLSQLVNFHDLGLVIVDEEQRFGVAHKEKLKLLKATVDFLTLTATPIPRTMKLAFLGLKDLSLMRTAPPKRQSIKTYIMKEDDSTIKKAIEKELARGGQVFLVHNRVNDIEIYVSKIKNLLPQAKITYAHGQMREKDLESRMQSFYSGEYQILVTTTIIESGLDIPNANTMIINRADTFGLTQLHQLRGRIGRSDKKAYAYFIIPKHKKLTPTAEQRLKALYTYADMGSGFNIASCDLEIRGAGDILGPTQSGHIENVGLELYMDLLKEAIAELKGEKKIIKKDFEISTPFSTYIPNVYIKDSSERLKIYKRLANCSNLELMNELHDEIIDRFGFLPIELSNLFTLLETRISLQLCGLKSLQAGNRQLILQFDKSLLDSNPILRDKIVKIFLERPKIYQFTPDYKVIHYLKDNVTPASLLTFAKKIADQIV